MTVKIITDSTSDLPPELARALDITVVPAYIIFGGRTYRDGVDISSDELYQKITEDDITITTSQPAPGDFAQVYRRLLKEADGLFSIQVTSRLSGVYNSALQAREMVGAKGRIEVFDSESTSMGLGLMALAVARAAKSGSSLAGVLAEALRARSGTHLWGMFDTLKYVLKGGRLGRARNMISSIINVKPMLTMKTGVINPTGFARTRVKGIEKLLDNLKNYSNIKEVGIAHSTNPEEAHSLRSRLSSLIDGNHIHVSRLGAALGVHGGPGTLVLAIRENAAETAGEATEQERVRKTLTLPTLHLPKLNLSSH